MTLERLPELLLRDSAYANAASYTETSCDFSAPEGLKAPLLATLYRERKAAGLNGAMLLIAATSREANTLKRSLQTLLPAATVMELPAWETLPHERLSPSRETTGKRLVTLAALRHKQPQQEMIVVASVRAVLQAISPTAATAEPLLLQPGSDVGALSEFAAQLIALGYERVDMVAKRGQFAVRGGILDIFVPSDKSATRIDFFGDEIDTLRSFAVSDQRSQAELQELAIWPARELLLTPEVQHEAAQLALKTSGKLQEMCSKIAAGISCEGMESLLPQLVPQQFALPQLLPADSFTVVLAPEKVTSRAVSLAQANAEFLAAAWEIAAAGGDAGLAAALGAERDGEHGADTAATTAAKPPVAGAADDTAGGSTPQNSGLFTLTEVRQLAPTTWHTISPFAVDPAAATDSDATVQIPATQLPAAVGGDPTANLLQLAAAKTAAGYTVVLIAGSAGAAQRAAELVREAELPLETDSELPAAPAAGKIYLVQGELSAGFELPEAKILVIAEAEFFGRSVSDRNLATAKPVRRRQMVDPLALKHGDYVVHDTHGIGKFLELTQLEVPGGNRGEQTTREYLVLEYAASKRGMPADTLYVPTDQLGQLSRYVGADAPTLSKMGGSDWANAKKKARGAVRQIAIELVKLYAARANAQGFAFSPDTPWQLELEQAFPYVETVDQLQAIADVKRDMESPRPMDRLISGDVGFGKTEIAVRAAFKAVQDNKQVAVLVPTTLLVKQHFETFQERFAGFPVRLRALSRFQTDKEAKEILDGLKSGEVDVVIGTHRLLAKGVAYKDLGLIIIDEEQRFGVEHKESLKDLKHNVDVLSMSATPIPRTLEMAVTGIREMSQLQTAPEDRHPILTYVGQRNDAQIAAAIHREMLRDGQVFYVHNRVSSIHRVAKRIAESVPEARVAVAHGKLSQSELEQVVVDFWERKYDVLVCTTIIETGLDIANANTIIVDGADKYGLSQLHQLRGRVGRSRERAYAYFLYEPERMLTEHAHERLETIATHNELGSGMQVALKDLELRGAGNLLGGEQSGHISGVGFDLYLRMIGEAVDAFKGHEAQEVKELTIELPVDARIPESYLDSERLRLEAYQKLSAAANPNATPDGINLVVEELVDRYGPLPPAVSQLVQLTRLRRLAAEHGVQRLLLVNNELRIEPLELLDSRQMRLRRLYPGAEYRALPQRGATADAPRHHVVTVPLPEGLSGGGRGSSPFARGAKAADQALDGDLVAWVLRVFAALVGEA
ncbi:transcription-repair coupling factor [Leucobacter sp. OH2974_COT-288]|nr:transcription-repair coupling factor [Leucobacter sp. OH2974_COT-288]